MKLSELQTKLLKRDSLKEIGKRRLSSLRKEFKTEKVDNYNGNNSSKLLVSSNSVNLDKININTSNYNIDDLVIIGVSGSKGKSSVCKMIHEYLKSIGKKSVLYSSVEIDSFASIKTKHTSVEKVVQSENTLLDIIEECIAYESEYLVLEVNDRAIHDGLIKDIPFDIRVLTNVHKKNSTEFFKEDEYFALKKSFIRDFTNDNNCKCILGMCDQYKVEDFNDLVRSANGELKTYGTKFLCEAFNVSNNNLDYMAYGDETSKVNSLNGINFKIRIKDEVHTITSKSIFSFSVLNILSAVSVLDTLNLFDVNKFNSLISKINIDGRDELIYANGRYFLIGVSLMPHLELLNLMKENKEFKKLKLIMGSQGSSFITWDEYFSSDLRKSRLSSIRKQAASYASKYCDFIYLTSNDPGGANKMEILNELRSYVKDKEQVKIVVDRKSAIREAIKNSNVNDLIYISGRGNRNVFCNSYDEMQLFTDKEVLLKELKDLGWL